MLVLILIDGIDFGNSIKIMYQKLYNIKAHSRDMESRKKMQIHS